MYFDKESFLEPKVSQYGSHLVMTNVNKETKRKYINIDTRFRDEYNDIPRTGNLENIITLPDTLTDIKSIMICNAEIPLSYYNISDVLGNNAFSITYSDLSGIPTGATINIPYVFVLNDGVYDTTGLANEINNKLANYNLNPKKTINFTTDISFSITNSISSRVATTSTCYTYNYSNFNSVTGLATINFALNGSFSCNGINTNIGILTPDFEKVNYKTKLGWLLGYRRQIQYSIPAKGSDTNILKSESIIDLNGPRYLYIVVDEFSKGNQNSFISPLSNSIINKNILARLSFDAKTHPLGSILSASIINGKLLSDRRSYTGKIDIQKLKVQIVNEYGNPMNLNGLDFSFCLEVEHE
jgi:hypothetical protein